MGKTWAGELLIGEDPEQGTRIGSFKLAEIDESFPESLRVLQQELHPENAEDATCGHEQEGEEEQELAAPSSTLLDEQSHRTYEHGVDRQKQIAGAVATVTYTRCFFNEQLVLFKQVA